MYPTYCPLLGHYEPLCILLSDRICKSCYYHFAIQLSSSMHYAYVPYYAIPSGTPATHSLQASGYLEHPIRRHGALTPLINYFIRLMKMLAHARALPRPSSRPPWLGLLLRELCVDTCLVRNAGWCAAQKREHKRTIPKCTQLQANANLYVHVCVTTTTTKQRELGARKNGKQIVRGNLGGCRGPLERGGGTVRRCPRTRLKVFLQKRTRGREGEKERCGQGHDTSPCI